MSATAVRSEEEERAYVEPMLERFDGGHVYEVPHAQGEPCAVIDLLVGAFGEKDGMTLLFERTCFPCSDREAWEQAKELVRDHGAK